MFLQLLLFPIFMATAEFSETKCVDGEYSPDPCNCDKFMQCDYGRWIVRDCFPGTYWNPDINNCDWPYNVECKEIPAELSEIKCIDGEYSPYPCSCDKFMQCDHGRWIVRDCGPGTYWNPEINNCDWPYNVDCKVTPGKISETKCIDGQYSPDPYNCDKFMQCDRGKWIAKDCAPGTYWNPKINTCDWPYKVDCKPLTTQSPFTISRTYPMFDVRW